MNAAANATDSSSRKIIVRRLPPDLPESVFLASIQQCLGGTAHYQKHVEWMRYVPGKPASTQPPKPRRFSYAFLGFRANPTSTVGSAVPPSQSVDTIVVEFSRVYDGWLFRNRLGEEYRAVVELAPHPRIPQRASTTNTSGTSNNKLGSILEHPAYLRFVQEEMEAFVKGESTATAKPGGSSTNTTEAVPKDTPLLQHLRQRQQQQRKRKGVLSTSTSSMSIPKGKKKQQPASNSASNAWPSKQKASASTSAQSSFQSSQQLPPPPPLPKKKQRNKNKEKAASTAVTTSSAETLPHKQPLSTLQDPKLPAPSSSTSQLHPPSQTGAHNSKNKKQKNKKKQHVAAEATAAQPAGPPVILKKDTTASVPGTATLNIHAPSFSLGAAANVGVSMNALPFVPGVPAIPTASVSSVAQPPVSQQQPKLTTQRGGGGGRGAAGSGRGGRGRGRGAKKTPSQPASASGW